MATINSVTRFYGGKTIFITGASGFMGKVLIEKLLFNCRDITEIIVLMRDKKGVSSMQRVEKWKKLALFQPLLAALPDCFNKIKALHGDLLEPNFGLSDENLKKVLDNTGVFFHMAASLKMEAPLRYNIRYNLVGTKTALELAKKMKNLVSMVHLSTAFCNVEPEVVHEKVYDFSHDPEDLIKLSEWMTDDALEAMQMELIKPHPNTYTYTKRLAEIMVQREYKNLPICIVRPSVVLPSYSTPIPGWVDSLNGVVGIFYAGGRGVLRSMLADPKAKCEYVPVDVAINGIIMACKVCADATVCAPDIPVFHLTVHPSQKLELGYIFGIVKKLGDEYPASWPLWYPDGGMTMNKFAHWYRTTFFMMLPAYIIDFLLKLFGQKTFMLHVQKRIAVGSEVLQFFTMRNWNFKQENFLGLMEKQSQDEYEMFVIDCTTCTDQYEYIKNAVIGGRQYCVRDPLSTLPTARLYNKFLYILHMVCQGLFYYFVFTTLLKMFGLFEPLKATIASATYSR